MCGFVGIVNSQVDEPKEYINSMMEAIKHRGPDSKGYYVNEHIALGFRRLSIIDMTKNASQPMVNEDESVVLVFNGEIYNYQELRKELIHKNHTFKSNTDSEVIIHAYEEYGIDLLHRLRGMFAFVIWDSKKESVFIARDFFGIKPLYYSQNTEDHSMIFGSEIKSFMKYPLFNKELNKEALKPYLTFQYSAMDETFFKGVFKLKPGHYGLYKNGELMIKNYWRPDLTKENHPIEDVIDQVKDTVKASVDAHSISDVKVGSFLSGGVDSSYITALLKPDKTFTVGFDNHDDQFNETNLAKELSDILTINNYKKIINSDEFFEALPTIQYMMDEPEANLSAVPLYFLSKLAKEHVSVVLSGEGADELFAGYDWYKTSKKEVIYSKTPFALRRIIGNVSSKLPYNQITNFLVKGGQKIEEKFIGQAMIFKEDEALKILKPLYHKSPSVFEITKEIYKEIEGEDDLSKMQYLDMNLWMPGDILLKADKMSMAHSLELRVPYLDKEVMALAGTLPSNYKINAKNSKYVLREAAKEVIPTQWGERKKVGFTVPFKHWIREEKYYRLIKDMFESEATHEFFEQENLLELLEAHYKGSANNARQIYTVYTFLIWHNEFFGQQENEKTIVI